MESQRFRPVPASCTHCQTLLTEGARYCTKCGAPVPPVCGACGWVCRTGDNYCPQCGTSLGALAVDVPGAIASGGACASVNEAAAVERRQLTVLFCDLVGSTEMSARLDPEDLREVMAAYHQCIADTVRPFDGFVARYMGDGALIFFGYPVAHEDNAERALHAASALVANVRKLAVLGQTLHARIGVATGLVVVGELVNSGGARERTALGETPNLAARLQAIAEPDAVVVADSTKRLAGERFVYRDLGAVSLKGFETAPRVWQVIGRPRTRPAFAALRPAASLLPGAVVSVGPVPLVGREQELGLLRDRWDQVVEGHGQVVLLTGDPGIGKSRLVQSLIASFAAEPHVLLELHCSAQYANSPLYPVAALLPNVLSWGRSDSDETKLEKLLRFCDRYGVSSVDGVPLLMSLLGMPACERFPLPPMSPERQKQRILQTLLAAVLAVAAEYPVLAVVEDLHWIDPTTMEFLTLLVDQVPTVRMLVLLTARLHFQTYWPPHSHVMPIVLTRFTARQAAEMVERVAGAGRLSAETITRIVARTDGVPLFVEELTKTVLESCAQAEEELLSHAAPSPLAIPATLQDSLTARLDLLSTVKVIAQLGAAIGREFSYTLLQAVTDVDEAVLDHELGQLVEAEFLYQRGVGAEATFVFKHALIQEAAYQSLLRSTRQQYHRRIALAMVERFSKDADARPEYVAMQFTEGGDVVAAVQWWQKAGQHAFKRAAFREGTVHFGKGLALLSSAPASRQRDQMELALQVELGYALIPISGWAAVETAQAFQRAGELCRQIGDTPVLFRALWGLGAFHFVRGDQRAARQVAEQCLSVAAAADDLDALCEAHYLCGITCCAMGEFVSGQSHLEECIRLYRDENRETHRMLYGQDAKACALGWLGMALWVLGLPDEALARADAALAYVRDARQPFQLARGYAGVGFVGVFRGEPQGQDSPLQAALDVCAEQGFAYFHAVVSAFKGADLVHLGRLDEGVALMEASIRGLRAIGSELLFTIIIGHLASAHLAMGRIEEGLASVENGLECVERTGERWGEAELHRLRGELLLARGGQGAGEAESCFNKALQIARRQHAHAYAERAERSLARLQRAVREGSGEGQVPVARGAA